MKESSFVSCLIKKPVWLKSDSGGEINLSMSKSLKTMTLN